MLASPIGRLVPGRLFERLLLVLDQAFAPLDPGVGVRGDGPLPGLVRPHLPGGAPVHLFLCRRLSRNAALDDTDAEICLSCYEISKVDKILCLKILGYLIIHMLNTIAKMIRFNK